MSGPCESIRPPRRNRPSFGAWAKRTASPCTSIPVTLRRWRNERKIIANAANKNRLKRSNTNYLQQTVAAESNLEDVANIVAQMHRNKEPLLHAAVFLELSAHDLDQLKLLQTEVLTKLIRSKLNVDRLMLRQ